MPLPAARRHPDPEARYVSQARVGGALESVGGVGTLADVAKRSQTDKERSGAQCFT